MVLSIEAVIVFLELVITGILLLLIVDIKRYRRNDQRFSHFRYVRDRCHFNKIGIEIVNGALPGDTLYLVFRSGTFGEEFSDALRHFNGLEATTLIVIVPEYSVFRSSSPDSITGLVDYVYENPNCDGVRAMLLKSKRSRRNLPMSEGYVFVSDGHIHEDDEGFCVLSTQSANFLDGYFQSLVMSGEKMLPATCGDFTSHATVNSAVN